MVSGGTTGGAASALLSSLPKLTLGTAERSGAYLERCRRIPGYLRDAETQLGAGVAASRVPAACLIVATLRQVERHLATPPDADPLPPDGGRHPDDVRTALLEVLTTQVRPALARHRDVLADRIAPHAGRDDRVGLCWLPDGEQAYREALDGRSDLYAAGIALWELLAHQRLRVGTAGKGEVAMDFQAMRRPSENRHGVPADIEAVASPGAGACGGAGVSAAPCGVGGLWRDTRPRADARGYIISRLRRYRPATPMIRDEFAVQPARQRPAQPCQPLGTERLQHQGQHLRLGLERTDRVSVTLYLL